MVRKWHVDHGQREPLLALRLGKAPTATLLKIPTKKTGPFAANQLKNYIKSTHSLSHGAALASFDGSSPYFFCLLLFCWHTGQILTWLVM
jgi:hypothetical protein